MSILVAVPGQPQNPTSVSLTTTATTDIKSFVAGTTGVAFITGIIIVNDSGSAVLVKVYRTDNATDTIIYTGSVPANSTILNAIDAPLAFKALETPKKIRAQAATGGSVITVTVIHNLLNQQSG